MSENEAILIIGAEQFCKYTGYGYSFTFAGTLKYLPHLPLHSVILNSIKRRVHRYKYNRHLTQSKKDLHNMYRCTVLLIARTGERTI